MAYQEYKLHLTNGHTIHVVEEYDLPFEEGIVMRFKKAKSNDFIDVNDTLLGNFYIPARNIVYISTGDVINDD